MQLDTNGNATGVKLANGEYLEAAHTVLCSGAYTPTILEYSAESAGRPNISAGSRIVAGGITTGMTKLDDKTYQTYRDIPVGVQGYTVAQGKFPDLSRILLRP